jgi:methyl-accepting chemotaxis protein
MRLTVRWKLFGGFGLVLFLIVLLGLLSITSLADVNTKSESSFHDATQPLAELGDAGIRFNENRAFLNNTLLETDASATAALDDEMTANDAEIDKDLDRVRPTLTTPKAEDTFAKLESSIAAYRKARAPISALERAGKVDEAHALNKRTALPEAEKTGTLLDDLFESKVGVADSMNGSIESAYHAKRLETLILLALALVLGAGLAFWIARGVVGAISTLVEATEQMGDGDLTVDPQVGSNDELGDMAKAFRAMAARLRGVVAKVAEAANTLNAASEEMASTSDEAGRAVGEIANAVSDVAEGAEKQVRMVDSARQATEEVTASVLQSAASAQETAAAADEARSVAHEGVAAAARASSAMEAVRDSSLAVNEAMQQLSAKSEQIGGIVETITAIAGQTNLLALNAAIEAARAGEQGKGFAVVAEEVRKLAEESQDAAGSIASLVQEMQLETGRTAEVVAEGSRRSDEGVAIVDETRAAFERIGSSVESVTDRVGEIASVTQQIAATASRVQDDITQVASVAEQSSAATEEVSASTEQTSASAQEIAASAQELARTAEELAGLVAQFKVA